MQFGQMRRREFITLFGGAAAWPLAALAQQPDGMRHVGVHLGFKEGDPEAQPLVVAFKEGLQELGWTDGRNIRLDCKRLEMLHALLQSASSIGYLVNPTNVVYAANEPREMEAAARSLGVRLLVLNASVSNEFEAAFMTIVREGASGVVVGGDLLFFNHDKELVALAVRFKVPTMFRFSESVAAGGLASYSTDLSDAMRQATVYAGRILKGEKPTDLPVQQVTKMLLTINMKTAQALGLTVPITLLGRADQVIE